MSLENSDNDRTESFVPLTKGIKVGHYTIVKKIGAGGMGEVWLAEDTELKRKVALKFLPAQMSVDEDCRKRFKREAQAAAKLEHPNIVTIHEVSEFQGRPFFAMQYVSEMILKDYDAQKKLSLSEIIKITIGLCEGLSAAHQAKVIHRDIKPSNILIDESGIPRIVDFGVAHVIGATKLTATGSTLGTLEYMSPEQVGGQQADQRSDLFSLGVVLYELITGKLPFTGDYPQAVTYSILHDVPEPLARYKSDIPEQLQQIIDKALEKNVETRYQTAAGMMADLRRLALSEGVTVPKRKKMSKLTWAAAILVMMIVGVWGGLQVKDWLTPTKALAKSLAVVDFENVGAEEDAYLASGLAEDLAIKLRQLGGIRVASTADIRRLAKENLLPREIAARLKVQYALGGSLLRQDTLVRVNVELIEKETGDVVWSDQIDKRFTEIFQFLDEVSVQIAQALEVRLTPVEEAAIAENPTDNATAYDNYLKGRHYYYNITFRDNELAEREFERALQLDQDYPLALAGLADVYVQRFEERFDHDEYWLDSSKVLIQRALEIEPELAEAYESRAELYVQLDNIKGAFDAANKARKLRPSWDEPYIHLGNIYKKRGKRDSALAMYDTALNIRPSVAALCGKGNIFQIRGYMDSARTAYQTAAELNPDHDRPYLDLARLSEELFEGAESERLYRRAIEVRPDHVKGYELLSQRMYYRGSVQEGEDLLRSFVEKYPYNWDAYKELYEYLAWWREDYPAAFKVVEESLNRNPNRVWPHLLLASSYAEKISPETEADSSSAETEKAVLAVDRALTLRPKSGRALEWAGNVYYILNRLEEALDYYNQAYELRPGSSELLGTIAWALSGTKKNEKAASFALAAIECSPGIYDYYYILRYVLLPLNRGEEFFNIIKQAAEKYGDDPQFLQILSEEHRLAGNYEDAVSIARRALAIKPVGWGGHTQLAAALWLSGNVEEALENFKKEIDQYTTASWVVAILRSEGRLEEIETYLESIKIETPDHVSGIDHWADVAGYYYRSMQRYDDALAVYEEYRASGEETNPALTTRTMAGCYRNKGDFDTSKKLLDELLQTATGAERPQILIDLSYLHAIFSQDLEVALKVAEQASDEQNIPNSYVTEILLRLKFACGRLDEIEETIDKVKEGVKSNAFLYCRAQLATVTELENADMLMEHAILYLTRMSRGACCAYHLCSALAYRALALARSGDTEEAAREVKRSIKMEPERANVAYRAACTYSLLGDTTLALQWLETSVEREYLLLWWARVDPDLDPLRELPRFKEIMTDWDGRIQALIKKYEKEDGI